MIEMEMTKITHTWRRHCRIAALGRECRGIRKLGGTASVRPALSALFALQIAVWVAFDTAIIRYGITKGCLCIASAASRVIRYILDKQRLD